MVISHFVLSADSSSGSATLQKVTLSNLAEKAFAFQFRYRTSRTGMARKIALYSSGLDYSELLSFTEGPAGFYASRLLNVPAQTTVVAFLNSYSDKGYYPGDGPYKGHGDIDLKGIFEIGLPSYRDLPWQPMQDQGVQPVPILIDSRAVNYTPATGYVDGEYYPTASGGAEVSIVPEPIRSRLQDALTLVSISGEAKKQKDLLSPVVESQALSEAVLLSVLAGAAENPDGLAALERLLDEAKIGISLSRRKS
ncbi:hypothetical protein BH11ARM1_BH11ARM1_16930 [soil metagenome]